MVSKGERDVLVLSGILKVLLYPAYWSTDFEVHRNWLAITHHLPLKEWYQNATSEWTLDYPPFFAWFSYVLALPARLLPSSISEPLLRLSSQPVETWPTVAYMRTSVLMSELCLLLGCLRLAKRSSDFAPLAVFYHPGFLILDNIHFQYNAFLFGLMIWSFVGAQRNMPLTCAFFFAVLLNFKHIYIYQAPAWFIYLFRAYCFPNNRLRVAPLASIGAVVSAVFAISLVPFLVAGQGSQLLARLFPFSRGLMHAYWAPNAWAGVALTDRVLLKLAGKLDLSVSSAGVASASRGLVGDSKFAVLPEVTPLHCFALTAVTQIIQLVPLWKRPTYTRFLQAVAACGFSSFMFGWHVHEKAIMLVLVPLGLLATQDHRHYHAFLLTTIPGIISLFPMLFHAAETPIKMIYSLIWLLIVSKSLKRTIYFPPPTLASTAMVYLENAYLFSAIPLLVFTSIVHPLKATTAEFLPLMLTSVWCSVGVWAGWLTLLYAMFRSDTKE